MSTLDYITHPSVVFVNATHWEYLITCLKKEDSVFISKKGQSIDDTDVLYYKGIKFIKKYKEKKC